MGKSRRRLKQNEFTLKSITPLTDKQKESFEAWNSGSLNLIMHGIAGTGKTFLSMYFAFEEILNYISEYDSLVIIRSIVPTRDIGFLPGTAEEKSKIYELPYHQICTELFDRGDSYEILKQKNIIHFITTSFVRGMTINNAIVLVDEINNMNFHELDSVITRLGKNCKVIFSGDYRQSDLKKNEREGLKDFLSIIGNLSEFHQIEFGVEDIVRSKLVKSYIIEKNKQGFS